MAIDNAISENGVSFYSAGGHSHDGRNSTLIDTTAYSIYDFTPGILSDNPERRQAQVRNYNSFKQLVVNTINSTILEPAGIVLQDNIINSRNIISGSITAIEIAANTITANNIAAGAITADQLSANLVLVNNVIKSNNFDGTVAANGAITSQGTVGWAVTGYGHAVFDTTYIRGSLTASSVSTPGVDILSNGTLAANNFTLYGNGAIVTSGGNFSVTASGVMSATGASINGTIDASDGSIGAWVIDANGIYNSSAGRYVALYPSVGSISQNVFEVSYGGYTSEISASLIRVGSGAAFSYMSAGSIQTSGYLAVGGDIVINGPDHYADSVRPLVGASSVGVTGSGWVYFPSNMSHDYFPIALGYSNGAGQLRAIVDNNAGVYFNITKTSASDRRLKDNISEISDAVLNKFYSIKTYEFDWNNKTPQYLKHTGRGVGVIADELKELYPEAVDDSEAYEGWVHRYDEHPEGFSVEEMKEFGSDFYEFIPGEGVWKKPKYASVDYTVLIPHMLTAIKDLNNRVKVLENEV